MRDTAVPVHDSRIVLYCPLDHVNYLLCLQPLGVSMHCLVDDVSDPR